MTFETDSPAERMDAEIAERDLLWLKAKRGQMPTEPIEPMTPEKWVALEATQNALRVGPSSGITTIEAIGRVLSFTAAILAYHEQAKEIQQTAVELVKSWGACQYESLTHRRTPSDLESLIAYLDTKVARLCTALGVK